MRNTILALILSGCATFTNPELASGCIVADGVSTYVGLTKYGLVEKNPLFANASPGVILLFSGILAYAVWDYFTDRKKVNEGKEPPVIEKVAGTAIVLGHCGAAIHNINLIRSIP